MQGRPFFKPGGTLEPDARSYVVRKADEQLLAAITAGEYVFVLDSRQKGKSSLVSRALARLREQGVIPVKLDLQRIGSNVTPEQWYAGLAVGVGQELGLLPEVMEFWTQNQSVGPLARWVATLREVVLVRVHQPIAIFVDEVDFVRALSFSTDEFFAGIRDCFNRRAEDPAFRRLTFCLVGVAMPGQLIRNPDISPFNIGSRIDLTDFSREEIVSFAGALGIDGRDGSKLLERVHYWTGGHPYLTQLLCGHIATNGQIRTASDVDRLVHEVLLSPESRQREPNLADVERRLLDPDVPGLSADERRTQVLELYGRMLKSQAVNASEQNPVVATVRLSGVGAERAGSLRVRNRVYEKVFDNGWRMQNLPDAEVRRQRGAARLAVLRTALVAGVVIVGLTAASGRMFQLSNERQRAVTLMEARQSELLRVSGEREAALKQVQGQSEQLRKTSADRQAALLRLRSANERLGHVSDLRLQAVSSLQEQAKELQRAALQREEDLRALRAKNDEVQQRIYFGQMASLRQALSGESWNRASKLTAEMASSRFRGWEWGHAALVLGGQELDIQMPTSHNLEMDLTGPLRAVTYFGVYEVTSRGVKLLRRFAKGPIWPGAATANVRTVQDPATREILLLDANTDKVLQILRNDISLRDISVDGKRILVTQRVSSSTDSFAFQVRTLDSKEVLLRVDGPRSANAVFMRDGGFLNSNPAGVLERRDAAGKILHTTRADPDFRINFARTFLLTKDIEGKVLQVRNPYDLSILTSIEAPTVRLFASRFSRDGRKMVLGFADGQVRVYAIPSGELLQTYIGHRDMIRGVGFVDRGRIASSDIYGNLKIWAPTPRKAIEVFMPAAKPDLASWLDKDNRILRSITVTQGVRARNLQTGRIAEYEVPGLDPFSQSAEEGAFWYFGLADGTLEKRTGDGLQQVRCLKVFDGKISRTMSMENGRILLESRPPPGHSRTDYAIVKADDLTIQCRFSFDWPQVQMSPPVVTSDRAGKRVAVSTCEMNPPAALATLKHGTIYVIDARTGKLMRKLAYQTPVYGLAMTPDGKGLIVDSAKTFTLTERVIALHEVDTLRKIRDFTPPGPNILITAMILSPNGRRLLAWTLPNDMFLWDVPSGKLVSRTYTKDPRFFASFSADSTRILTSTRNRTNTIFDAETGEELYVLQTTPLDPAKPVSSDAMEYGWFSEDGRKIVTTSSDGVVRIWNSVSWKDQPKAARKKGS